MSDFHVKTNGARNTAKIWHDKPPKIEDNTVHKHDPDDSEMSWDFDEEEYVQEIMHKEEEEEEEGGEECL